MSDFEEQNTISDQQSEQQPDIQVIDLSVSESVAPVMKEETPKRGRIGMLILGILIGALISNLVVLAMLKIKGPQKLVVLGEDLQDTKSTVLTKDVSEKLSILEKTIRKYYIDEVKNEDMADGLYAGLLGSIGDRYADYYTQDDMNSLMEKTTGVFYGIGAYVGIDADTNYPKLTGIIENTPAEKAGLKAEDILIKVDDKNVRGMELSDVVSLIKGDAGTDVVLTIYRNGVTDYFDVTVTRAKVESPTVTYEMKEDNIAYIYIHQFESVTSDQFAEKLQQARDDQMKGLIIDLRSNPGGTMGSVIEVARMLLPKGIIVYTEDKYGDRKTFKCDGDHEIDVPMVLLINENSASASEILAGAVKDYGIGTLVGKKTFGKGIVQKVFYLSDGSGLKLTISHYYTPKGNDIHEVGIEPDVEVDLDVDKYLDEDIDTQYDKAMEVLKEKMK